jgi:hypothetical protein
VGSGSTVDLTGGVHATNLVTAKQPEEETPGEVYRGRSRKKFLFALLTITIILILLAPGIFYFFINYTPYGYREKVMYKYGFTAEARNYLRSETSIDVINLSETKPFGLTHSGFWRPERKNVKLNTASDEVAVHEFAHAWWEELRKDPKTKKDLVNDTIKLSKMADKTYYQVIRRSQWIVKEYCSYSDTEQVDYEKVDDHHFYAFMADFTMGKFKSGTHKLPQFMWKYFDGLFSSSLKVVPCYETGNCGFPDNNGYSYLPNRRNAQSLI